MRHPPSLCKKVLKISKIPVLKGLGRSGAWIACRKLWVSLTWKQGPTRLAIGAWNLVNCFAGSKEQGTRQRKGASPTEKKPKSETQHEGVELRVENLQAVQTDFSPDPLQKVVCFNHDNTLLATGGTDGYVRIWKVWVWGVVVREDAGHS